MFLNSTERQRLKVKGPV